MTLLVYAMLLGAVALLAVGFLLAVSIVGALFIAGVYLVRGALAVLYGWADQVGRRERLERAPPPAPGVGAIERSAHDRSAPPRLRRGR